MIDPYQATRRNETDQGIQEFILRHKEALRWVVELVYETSIINKNGRSLASVATTVGIKKGNSTFLAVLARAYYHVPLDKLIRFVEVVHTGGSTDKEEAAREFASFFTDCKGQKNWKKKVKVVAQRAIKLFIEERCITQKSFRAFSCPSSTPNKKGSIVKRISKLRAENFLLREEELELDRLLLENNLRKRGVTIPSVEEKMGNILGLIEKDENDE